MQQRLPVVVTVAVALMAAAPVYAQRTSLADRVARLEQHNSMQSQGAGQANLELQNRVTDLQSEVASLRNLVEQLQNDNAQLKQRAREQYIDLDSRLARLEGGTGAAGTSGAVAATAADAAVETAEPTPAIAAKPAQAPAEPSDPAQAEVAYAQALDTLVQRYEAAESARLFQSFLQTYPDSTLVPNAWYWLGESYYVTQNYELAAESFQTAITQYPGSRKEPDALLKLAYCHIALGRTADAEAGLRDVITRYPDSDAAGKAQSRLQTLIRDGR